VLAETRPGIPAPIGAEDGVSLTAVRRVPTPRPMALAEFLAHIGRVQSSTAGQAGRIARFSAAKVSRTPRAMVHGGLMGAFI